jgi:hypothetical protein
MRIIQCCRQSIKDKRHLNKRAFKEGCYFKLDFIKLFQELLRR